MNRPTDRPTAVLLYVAHEEEENQDRKKVPRKLFIFSDDFDFCPTLDWNRRPQSTEKGIGMEKYRWEERMEASNQGKSVFSSRKKLPFLFFFRNGNRENRRRAPTLIDGRCVFDCRVGRRTDRKRPRPDRRLNRKRMSERRQKTKWGGRTKHITCCAKRKKKISKVFGLFLAWSKLIDRKFFSKNEPRTSRLFVALFRVTKISPESNPKAEKK